MPRFPFSISFSFSEFNFWSAGSKHSCYWVGVTGSHHVSLIPNGQKQLYMAWQPHTSLPWQHSAMSDSSQSPAGDMWNFCIETPNQRSLWVSIIPVCTIEMMFPNPEGKAASCSTLSVTSVLIDQIEAKINFSFHFFAAAFYCFIVIWNVRVWKVSDFLSSYAMPFYYCLQISQCPWITSVCFFSVPELCHPLQGQCNHSYYQSCQF